MTKRIVAIHKDGETVACCPRCGWELELHERGHVYSGYMGGYEDNIVTGYICSNPNCKYEEFEEE